MNLGPRGEEERKRGRREGKLTKRGDLDKEVKRTKRLRDPVAQMAGLYRRSWGVGWGRSKAQPLGRRGLGRGKGEKCWEEHRYQVLLGGGPASVLIC